jgi:hypothetical protein
MSHRSTLQSGFLVVAAFAAVASCAKAGDTSSEKSLSTKKAAHLAPGGLAALPAYLEDMIANAGQFSQYLTTVETQTPRQNGHSVMIAKNASYACTGAKARLTFQTYSTAGEYTQGEMTAGDGTTEFGYALGAVNNETSCVPISIPLPGESASDAGTAIVFVAKEKSSGTFKLFVVDSTTLAILARYDFKACDPDGKPHPWYGDHSVARKWGDKCDHAKPSPTLARATTPDTTKKGAKEKGMPPATFADNIDDAWTLWISCGADCCYADTGGVGVLEDSLHRDSTHHDSGGKRGSPIKKA